MKSLNHFHVTITHILLHLLEVHLTFNNAMVDCVKNPKRVTSKIKALKTDLDIDGTDAFIGLLRQQLCP